MHAVRYHVSHGRCPFSSSADRRHQPLVCFNVQRPLQRACPRVAQLRHAGARPPRPSMLISICSETVTRATPRPRRILPLFVGFAPRSPGRKRRPPGWRPRRTERIPPAARSRELKAGSDAPGNAHWARPRQAALGAVMSRIQQTFPDRLDKGFLQRGFLVQFERRRDSPTARPEFHGRTRRSQTRRPHR